MGFVKQNPVLSPKYSVFYVSLSVSVSVSPETHSSRIMPCPGAYHVDGLETAGNHSDKDFQVVHKFPICV